MLLNSLEIVFMKQEDTQVRNYKIWHDKKVLKN